MGLRAYGLRLRVEVKGLRAYGLRVRAWGMGVPHARCA